MTTTYDLVIRNGLIVDGSGKPAYRGDVAIQGSRIAAVGAVDGTGKQEIDAQGNLVTPGFVDIHTHYDGQATWENRLSPSSNHGVTTVLTGNCGVGFAPCRAEHRDALIKLMDGVEDIPEVVMATGLPWNWESFPEYLDALEAREFDIDIATQIPHSALRVFVMGERGADHEASTQADRDAMTALVEQGIRAGALGVSTSRSINHVSRDGKLAPSVHTAREELFALADGLRQANAGVFQLIPEPSLPVREEAAVIRDVAARCGRPVSFSLMQVPDYAEDYRVFLEELERANADGQIIRGQIFPRPVGVLFGLDLSLHPFSVRPSYRAIAQLPLDERVAIMRDPVFKAKLLAEDPTHDPVPLANRVMRMAHRMFRMTDPINYAPPADQSIGALAERAGRSIDDFVYDLLLEEDGHAVLYLPGANYVGFKLDAAREMMRHPHTILGLGDGGAHYGAICDASFPTFTLTHWVRDAKGEDKFELEWAIASLTRKPAEAVGLTDRGLLAPGLKADVNIIDLDRLVLKSPRTVYDLPAGGRRLRQEAEGYRTTIVSGQVTYRDGEPTGALPGRLVRGSGSDVLAKAA